MIWITTFNSTNVPITEDICKLHFNLPSHCTVIEHATVEVFMMESMRLKTETFVLIYAKS